MREVRANGLMCVGIVLALCTYSRAATAAPIVASSPIGVALLETLGTRATDVLAPSTRLVGALVGLPRDARAQDFGLEPVAPGIGRLRGTPARITAFAAAHPDLRIEMAPPLHPMMDRVSASVLAAKAREVRLVEGRGVMVGVADSGIDVTHPEMRDATGGSRVAWLLDLSLEPAGLHPELEDKFGIKDDTGKVIAGRVLDSHDIDALLAPWRAERLPLVEDRVRGRLKQLSTRLGDADWLDGAFSAGDLMMVSVLLRVRPSGLLDEYSNLAAYVARGEARPAYKRAFAAQLAIAVVSTRGPR